MSKIKVPEDMVDATHKALGGFTSHAAVERALEAAVCWLDAELAKMIKDNPYANDQYWRSESMGEQDRRGGHNHAIGMVRSMFLVPEPKPLTTTVPKSGAYHIDERGNATAYIKCEEVKDAQVWRNPSSLECSICGALGAHRSAYGDIMPGHTDHATQQEKTIAEVDATIPDLLFDYPTHVTVNVANNQIRKAFRRGFNKGAKHGR